MTPAARVKYHRDLWPACCRAQRWDVRDVEKRRAIVLECMRLVKGPSVTTSSPIFGADETTALFTYLSFLADQASLDKSARWADCQEDYRAFNRALNADWHERQTYGPEGSKRLQKQRFGGRKTAAGEPLESFDPEEIRKRHITSATRHRNHEKNKAPAAPAQRVIILPPPRVETPLQAGVDF